MAKLKSKLREMAATIAYFSAWIGALILLKTLVLREYHIDFVGWSKVLVGALLLSKVVRLLDHVPFGKWIQAKPAWMDVGLRTALYSAGLAAILLLDAGWEGREEHGGFVAALKARHEVASFPHILVDSICLTGAFFFYNVLSVLRRYLGDVSLFRLFLKPIPTHPEPAAAHDG